MYDVIVIGAGVVGCSIARELTIWKLKVLVAESGADVCVGTSKANSGIVHAGYDAVPGTRKAYFNVEGNRMMPSLSRELDFPFEQNGSLVAAFSKEEEKILEDLLERGKCNGVEGLSLLSHDEARKKEPNLSDAVYCALWAPTGGIVDPFLLTIAMAENAAVNGAEFRFNTRVTEIAPLQETTRQNQDPVECGGDKAATELRPHYIVHMRRPDGSIKTEETAAVVNAAGVYADVFHNMVSSKKIHITPRKGQYLLMDKATKGFVHSTIFQCPTAMGKGVLVTPTAHGNLMIGPTAEDIDDKENTATTAFSLEEVVKKAGITVKNLPTRQVITSFAGLRAHEDSDDFVIGEVTDAPYFFDAAGMESPGLTSAPAVAKYLAERIADRLTAEVNSEFHAKRKGIPCMATCSMEEREALIRENPLYANVICRCELVTEGEIVDAIHRPVGATTLDGIKRRVRAGMGRCQAGFCMPKQAEILSRELGFDLGDVTKSGGESKILKGYTR